MTTPRLRALQEWLSQVVQHPRAADAAIRAAAPRSIFPAAAVRAGQVVRPNDRMSPTDRLQVYSGAYLARLVEVMATDYPAVQHLVGERTFGELVAGYVQRHPSRHPNLNRFGREFPAFLRRRRRLRRAAFTAELARLELAVSRSFDAPEFTPLDPHAHAAVPESRWAGARLSLNPSVHLLALRWPTNDYYQAFRDERSPRPPRPGARWLVVYRKADRVWRMNLTRPMHAVLGALGEGAPLGAAVRRVGAEDEVMGWFGSWARDGLFADVRFGRR